jgi:hypothetical protein
MMNIRSVFPSLLLKNDALVVTGLKPGCHADTFHLSPKNQPQLRFFDIVEKRKFDAGRSAVYN